MHVPTYLLTFVSRKYILFHNLKLKTMAILIKPVQRVNPADKEQPKKWYITQVTAALIDESQIAMDISEGTTLDPSEAMMAIRQLRKVLLRRLLSGESVKMGNWGSFSITLTSKGTDSKDKLNANMIRSINLNFQPDKSFKEDLQKATFAWVDKLAGIRDTVEQVILSGRDGATGAENSTGTRGGDYIMKGIGIQLADKDEEHRASIKLINTLEVPEVIYEASTNLPDLVIFTIPIDLTEDTYTLVIETYYSPNGLLDEPITITAPFTVTLV